MPIIDVLIYGCAGIALCYVLARFIFVAYFKTKEDFKGRSEKSEKERHS